MPLRKGANGTDTAVTLLLIKSGPHTCLGAPSALQVAVSASSGPLFLRFTRDALTGRERRGPHPDASTASAATPRTCAPAAATTRQ